MEPLLTIKDAAVILSLPETTIRSWIAEGRLRSVKLGQSVRIRRQDLEAFIRGAAGDRELPPQADVIVTAKRFQIAAGGERVEVLADTFEVASAGTLILRDHDEQLVAVFPPDHWDWINRLDI